jgi:hypothetical protein
MAGGIETRIPSVLARRGDAVDRGELDAVEAAVMEECLERSSADGMYIDRIQLL